VAPDFPVLGLLSANLANVDSSQMEVAKLVLEFVKVLIWPATVLVLALIFRVPIRAVISRLKKAALPGGVSIDFQEEIEQAKELSAKLEAQAPPSNRPKAAAIPLTEANARMISLGLRPTASGLDMQYYREIAERDPNLALAGLRIELEIMANNLADGFEIASQRTEPLSRLLNRLADEGAISQEQLQLTKKVLQICNQAVHGGRVTRVEAEEVIDLATVLSEQYLSWLSWGFPDDWRPKAVPDARASS
jgi:hypothetical protein